MPTKRSTKALPGSGPSSLNLGSGGTVTEKKTSNNIECHDGLTIDNICGGAVPERFQRELATLLQNINDPNNPVDMKRKLTLEFEFAPFPDRSGAIVTLLCKSKLAAVESVQGGVYFARNGMALKAYAHDPQQARMFDAPSEVQ